MLMTSLAVGSTGKKEQSSVVCGDSRAFHGAAG